MYCMLQGALERRGRRPGKTRHDKAKEGAGGGRGEQKYRFVENIMGQKGSYGNHESLLKVLESKPNDEKGRGGWGVAAS